MNKQTISQRRFVRFKRFSRKAYSAFNSMHKVINIGVVAACTLTFANTGQATAQTISTQQPTSEETFAEQELEEVTITASRAGTPLSQAAKPITVITAKEIATAPVQSIEDLLVYAANIDVIQRGGHGVQSDISIRGGSADQTAVLLNGINLSNPHTGHYSFDFPINLSDIERIEILHGPSALIYGSSAFSGGINIITKKKPDTKLHAQIEGGMHSFRKAEARTSATIANTSTSLSVGYHGSGGYIDNSDYNIYNALWQARYAREATRIDIQTGYNNKAYGANTFYSAAYPNQYEHTSDIVGSISGTFGRQLKLLPQLYWTRHSDRFDLIKNTTTGRNYHKGDTYGINMMFQLNTAYGATHFGGEIRREEIMSSKLGKPLHRPEGHYTLYSERTQTNVALEHAMSWQRMVLSAGIVANYNTLQRDKVRLYPSVSAAYTVHPVKIHATWSRASRLPTFTDLFYTTETHNADETLQAERSESFDLAMTYKSPIIEATLSGYIMNGRNMIDWVRHHGETKWASWNFTKVNRQGIEAAIHFPFGMAIHYVRTNQQCDAGGFESRYTLNYLRDKLTASFLHKIASNLTASWNFRYQDRMGEFRKYDNNGKDMGIHSFPPFSTLDLKLMYTAGKTAFHLNLNNIYNTHYYDIGNVPQAGFWLTGGFAYKL